MDIWDLEKYKVDEPNKYSNVKRWIYSTSLTLSTIHLME